METNNHRFGCHVSVAGGLSRAFERAVDIGCDTIQIFSKNQKQWRGKALEEKEIERYHEERKRTSIAPIVIHDSYLINLCAPNPVNLKKSRESFADEVERAGILKAEYLNFHPGAHQGKGEDWGIKKIAESLNIITEKSSGSMVTLLLEATAGQGTSIGYRFEHLRRIIDLSEKKDRMAVCIDTAHIFAAGYDIRTEEAYEAVMSELNDVIGLDNVMVFHINDSKTELGSRFDRHENLGKGRIGLRAFEFFVNDERHAGKPMILETPGGEKFFKKNLKILRNMVKK